MTETRPCDHHDERGQVPIGRGRERMLEQLRAADALADALVHAWFRMYVDMSYERGDGRSYPSVVIEAEHLMPVLTAWSIWLKVAPRDDDLAAPLPEYVSEYMSLHGDPKGTRRRPERGPPAAPPQTYAHLRQPTYSLGKSRQVSARLGTSRKPRKPRKLRKLPQNPAYPVVSPALSAAARRS